MKTSILHTYAFNLGFAQLLLKGIEPQRACVQPVAGVTMNHAAWVIGHLAYGTDRASELLGLPRRNPDQWKVIFGGGSKPESDAAKYPPLPELAEALEVGHARVAEAFAKADDALFAAPAPERMRKRFATNSDFLVFGMTSHEMLHLGQLSAWRRAQGLPPVTG